MVCQSILFQYNIKVCDTFSEHDLVFNPRHFFMNKSQSPQPLPAPCIIDSGIIVNKEDMRRLLNDIGRVHYLHTLDGFVKSQGEGWIMEIFADTTQATLVANHALYLNLQSFDYLILNSNEEAQTCFELVQDNRHLRLTPLSSPLQEDMVNSPLDVEALEAMVTQVLSAQWDVQLDDDCPF